MRFTPLKLQSRDERFTLEIGTNSTGLVCFWYHDISERRWHYLHLACWRPSDWFSFGKKYEPNIGEYSYEAGIFGLYCSHGE